MTNARDRIRKASDLVGYYDGPTAGAPVGLASDTDTRVYPKGSPAVQAAGRRRHQGISQRRGDHQFNFRDTPPW